MADAAAALQAQITAAVTAALAAQAAAAAPVAPVKLPDFWDFNIEHKNHATSTIEHCLSNFRIFSHPFRPGFRQFATMFVTTYLENLIIFVQKFSQKCSKLFLVQYITYMKTAYVSNFFCSYFYCTLLLFSKQQL
jgi:hypothetical protein